MLMCSRLGLGWGHDHDHGHVLLGQLADLISHIKYVRVFHTFLGTSTANLTFSNSAENLL